jgi:alkylation response protein AidB-like acyl-CoA dehydrogenase
MSTLMAEPAKIPASADDDMLSMLRDSAQDFCTRALDRGRLRALRGCTPPFDRACWREMATLGWCGVMLPEDHDGLGLGTRGAATLTRALGAVAAPEPLIETAVAAAILLDRCAAAQPLIDAVISGETVVVAALGAIAGDPFGDIDVRGDETQAHLTGTLNAVPLGADVDAWLVPAGGDGAPAWCLVAADAPGVTIEPRPLADGSRDARILLTEAPAALLTRGDAARDAHFSARVAAELAASAYQVGLADTLLTMTQDYVATRRQFGKAIGSFQVLQHRLVDAYLALRLAEAVVAECCAAVDAGATGDVALRAASRACERSGASLALIAREAIQIHGAIGYTDECDVGLFVNRALVIGARYGRADAHVTRYASLITIAPGSDADGSSEQALADLEPPDGDWNALDNETFRQVVRQWHSANYPPELKNLRQRARWAQCREWYGQLYDRGFAAPGWPAKHGGMGLAPDKLLIFIEERERLGIARTPDQGIIMVGPLLMQHGSPEQQDYYLPKALSGEHIWCQGYSEPNAGSDLASLRTSAVRDGDEFVINGQKIWTTMAQDANQMFCLVRTDPQAKPQAGISFVLIDFATPGITVRPIRNIAGDEEFCEVFFDDVRVPCANLVGELNDGWTIAKALLGFERFFIGSPKTCRHALARIAELANARGLDRDPVFLDRYARFALDVDALEALYKSFADQIRRGESPGADVSLLKVFASETFGRLSEFILDAGGDGAAQIDGTDTAAGAIDALFPYYNARPTPIYGGSNEIQRNIIAKLVLRLPSA